MYEFLKSKKITVKSTGKMDASKLDLSSDNIDHYAETVKADAESSDGSDNSMSSDDEGKLSMSFFIHTHFYHLVRFQPRHT